MESIKLLEEGIYYDLPEESYHADPTPGFSLSAGLIKVLLNESPRHAYMAHPKLNPNKEPDNRSIFDIGKAAHSLILRDPKDFVIVEADDWRTKVAKEQRDAAYAEGKIPLLAHTFEEVKKMVDSARLQMIAHECRNAFREDSKSEITLVWQEDNGVWCRCRIDNMAANGKDFYDFKSEGQSANPDFINRQAFSLSWDIISAFYSRGIRKLFNIENPNYRFVVQEKSPPYCLSVIALEPSAQALGERKVEAAIKLWGECLKNNSWPGYPSRICYIAAPTYKETEWLQREEREVQASEEV